MESPTPSAIPVIGKATKRAAAPVRDRRVAPRPVTFRVHTFGVDERRQHLSLPERSRPGCKHMRTGSIDELTRAHMGAILAAKDAAESGDERDLRIALVRAQRIAIEIGRRYAELTGHATRVIDEPLDAMAMDWIGDALEQIRGDVLG